MGYTRTVRFTPHRSTRGPFGRMCWRLSAPVARRRRPRAMGVNTLTTAAVAGGIVVVARYRVVGGIGRRYPDPDPGDTRSPVRESQFTSSDTGIRLTDFGFAISITRIGSPEPCRPWPHWAIEAPLKPLKPLTLKPL